MGPLVTDEQAEAGEARGGRRAHSSQWQQTGTQGSLPPAQVWGG